MIAIVNVGPHDDADLMGERTYEVRINEQVITTFRHRRSETALVDVFSPRAKRSRNKSRWMWRCFFRGRSR
jgi:hypothetical protein